MSERIIVINPNSTTAVTADIDAALARFAPFWIGRNNLRYVQGPEGIAPWDARRKASLDYSPR